MINNPQLSLGSVEISVETPFASVTVFAGGEPGPDAISVASDPNPVPASLFEAAQGASSEAPGSAPSPFAGGSAPPSGLSAAGTNAGTAAIAGYVSSTGGRPRPGGQPVSSPGISANARVGASFAARSLEATLAGFTAQNAGSPAATVLANGALARVLVAAALGQTGAGAQMPHGTASLLTQAGALLRAADAAASPAATAALLDELATLVSDDARAFALAANAPPPQVAQSVNGIILPQWDPSARLGRADRKKTAESAQARAREPEHDRPIALPDRDARGRLYTERERRRLAQLAADPRRGYAPEGRIALAAEIEHGVRLERTYETGCDYADAAGGRWNVGEPLSVAGLETTLAGARAATHTILSAAALDAGDRVALDALVDRLNARAGSPRLLIVNGGDR